MVTLKSEALFWKSMNTERWGGKGKSIQQNFGCNINEDTKPLVRTEDSEAVPITTDLSEQEPEGSSQHNRAARLVLILTQLICKDRK